MNLLKLLEDEINTFGKTWDTFTKARYLYLRTCQLFEYDFRYVYGDKETKHEIYYRQFDIENMTNSWIICSQWAPIYKRLLNLIDLEGKIEAQKEHPFVEFDIEDYHIKADATWGADMSRVKFGSKTRNYGDNCKDPNFKERLEATDITIGYKKGQYTDTYISSLAKQLKELTKNKNAHPYIDSDFSYPLFEYKFRLIAELVNMNMNVRGYYDSDYYLKSYLINKLLTEWERNKVFIKPFYRVDNGNWDILDLICLEQEDKPSYFCLRYVDNGYCVLPISEKQKCYYLDHYEGKNKHLFM